MALCSLWLLYDPAEGDEEGGIEPGVAFKDLPDDWVCPICGVGKDEFKKNWVNKTVSRWGVYPTSKREEPSFRK